MPEIVNFGSAKTRLSKLLGRVMKGVLIAKGGEPIARLVPERPAISTKRVPGIDKGQIWISDDFDSLSERELAVWCGPKPLSSKRPRK